jgi:putative oxidoreductase
MSEAAAAQSRGMTIGVWVFRVLLAALFLFAGISKLVGTTIERDIFEVVGGQWLRYLTGLAEVVGAVTLLVPAVSAFGALILLAVDIAAFGAQITVLHQDWIHPIVIGALLAILVYIQRRQILNRLR